MAIVGASACQGSPARPHNSVSHTEHKMHDLLLQMVPGELNDELTTSDAMRRKLVHGIGHVLQKC